MQTVPGSNEAAHPVATPPEYSPSAQIKAIVAQAGDYNPDDFVAINRYWRAANYLGGAQIYLKSNVFLDEPLKPEQIKDRLLGHWGTVPGINLVWAHLNRVIKRDDASVMLIVGPGHGAPAANANLYLEGTLGDYYPELSFSREGVGRLVRSFSWPGGFPSHLFPGTPGAIHEGGELGYALATAYGAAFDNPDLVVACIVGDGEAETGPTATAWHCNKYLNPATDGAVLPILHLNGYKIASETIFGSMNDDELTSLFTGYGYEPILLHLSGEIEDELLRAHKQMAEATDKAFAMIRDVQGRARAGEIIERPKWPVLLMRSPKGWTGIETAHGKQIEGTFRAHQVPVEDVKTNAEDLAKVETWLRSYVPGELFDTSGRPFGDIEATCPTGDKRLGANPHTYGGKIRRELTRPDFQDYAVPVEKDERGKIKRGDTTGLGQLLRDVIKLNAEEANFRIVCPDELVSNKLTAVFEATTRQFVWPYNAETDDYMGRSGRVLEVLSEHDCQAWLQGYLLTGRHGIFPCYEAFVAIVDSMMNQFAKFLKQSGEIAWRKPISSFNYLLSSEGWRQDHNGYSHQGPGFINNLLNKKAKNVRVYLPPDTNCLLSTMNHCLTSTDKINLVIASKQEMPQWLTMDEAIEHCRSGASIWQWAGTAAPGEEPDVVLAGAGVYPMAEVMGAAWLLRRDLPRLKTRVVNVTDLLILERDTTHPHGLKQSEFDHLFGADRSVIFNFHGYPSAVKQLIFDRDCASRFTVNGYLEEGTTTTPFSLLNQNGVDRYTVAMQALDAASRVNPQVAAAADDLINRYRHELDNIHDYVLAHGIDPPEITQWSWTD